MAAEFAFKHGQYLTLRAVIDGEETREVVFDLLGRRRSSPMIAIKRIDGGRFSEYAHRHFRRGVTVDVAPPAGEFTTPLDPANRAQLSVHRRRQRHHAGAVDRSHRAAREPRSSVTLLYGNRRTGTMMFRDELSLLKNAYMDRFQWINVMSREQQEAEILNGRINNRKGAELNRRLIRIREFDEFFLCGPEAMISEVSRGLRGEGISAAAHSLRAVPCVGAGRKGGDREAPGTRAAVRRRVV